jgi:hypothetical protein
LIIEIGSNLAWAAIVLSLAWGFQRTAKYLNAVEEIEVPKATNC